MATDGNKALIEGIPQIKDAFVVIVKTEWNANYTDEMSRGAVKIFEQNGVSYHEIIVPGAVEIPFVVKAYQESHNKKADAFIAFGAVIKGETPHFDYVCKIVADGVTSLNLTLPVPTVFGILTVNNDQQVLDRLEGKDGHKGEEAAITAIKMININRSIG